MIATLTVVVVVVVAVAVAESMKMSIYKYLTLGEIQQHHLLPFLRSKHLMQFSILVMGQYGYAEGDANDDDDDSIVDDYADYDAYSDDDDDLCTNKSYCWLGMDYSCDSKFVLPYYNYTYLD